MNKMDALIEQAKKEILSDQVVLLEIEKRMDDKYTKILKESKRKHA